MKIITETLLFPLRVLGRFLTGGKDIYKIFKTHRLQTIIPIIYFTSGRIQFLKGQISKDLRWISPLNVNRLFRIKHFYTDIKGKSYAVIYDKNPETINFKDKPKRKVYKREFLDIKENDKGEIETTISLKDYEIVGGDVLSDIGYDLTRKGFIESFREASKSEILYIGIICGLIGIVIGIFLTGV